MVFADGSMRGRLVEDASKPSWAAGEGSNAGERPRKILQLEQRANYETADFGGTLEIVEPYLPQPCCTFRRRARSSRWRTPRISAGFASHHDDANRSANRERFPMARNLQPV